MPPKGCRKSRTFWLLTKHMPASIPAATRRARPAFSVHTCARQISVEPGSRSRGVERAGGIRSALLPHRPAAAKDVHLGVHITRNKARSSIGRTTPFRYPGEAHTHSTWPASADGSAARLQHCHPISPPIQHPAAAYRRDASRRVVALPHAATSGYEAMRCLPSCRSLELDRRLDSGRSSVNDIQLIR